MIKSLKASAADLWLLEQDYILERKNIASQKYGTLKASYINNVLRFFTKRFYVTNFPFKTGLDCEIKQLSKEIL